MKRLWVISDLRRCRDCGLEKPEPDFVKNSRLPSGRTRQCKKCQNAYMRRRRENPAVVEQQRKSTARWRERNPNADRDKHLRRKYGITSTEFDVLLAKQGGVCALCGNDEPVVRNAKSGKEALAVDHCHQTGRVRGLLCFKCNTALGAFGDDASRLQLAIDYLSKETA